MIRKSVRKQLAKTDIDKGNKHMHMFKKETQFNSLPGLTEIKCNFCL